ncbi:MAG: YfhO family protein [Blastopirellula sp. JB062]
MSNRAGRFRLALLPLLPLAALLLSFFGPSVVNDESFVFRDAAHFYYPLFAHTQSIWGEGRPPLWNQYDGVGMPLLAEPSATVFYPGKLLFALPLPFAATLRWYVILHFVLAYLTTYNAVRRVGVSRAGAILAAITYSFGGYVVAAHANVIFLVGAAWAPLALYAGTTLAEDRPRPTAAPLFAFSLAMMILGGDPQAAFHLALIACGYFVYRQSRLLRIPLLFGLQGRGLALSLFIAAGLSAVQILPTLDWAARSRRALVDSPRTIYAYARQSLQKESASADVLLGKLKPQTQERESYQFSLGPWRWPELIWSNFTGRMYPEHRRWADALPAEGRVWAPSLYVGGLAVLLALIGAVNLHREKLGKLLIALSAIGVLGSLGWYGAGWLLIELGHTAQLWSHEELPVGAPFGGLYWLLNVAIPGYASFRYPAKLWLLATLAGSWLVGFGFDAERRCDFRLLSKLALLLVSLSGIALVVVASFKGSLVAAFADAPANLLFGPLDAAGGLVDMQLGMLQSTLAAALVWGSLRIFRTRPLAATTSLCLILILDLYVGLGWTVQSAPSAMWESRHFADAPGTRWYRTLSANDYPPRFAAESSADRQIAGLAFDRETLFPRYHLLEKVGGLAPSNSLAPADYQILLKAMTEQLGAEETARRFSAVGLITFDPSPPQGIVVRKRLASAPTPPVWIASSHRLDPIANPRSRENWRDAAQAVIERNEGEAIVAGETSSLDKLDQRGLSIADQATITRRREDLIRLDVALSRPAYVVVQEYYDPGWQAHLSSADGAATTLPVERANLIFQAIALPAGRHQVTLRYQPASFYRGAVISSLSGLLLIVWIATIRLRKAPHDAAGVRSEN